MTPLVVVTIMTSSIDTTTASWGDTADDINPALPIIRKLPQFP